MLIVIPKNRNFPNWRLFEIENVFLNHYGMLTKTTRSLLEK